MIVHASEAITLVGGGDAPPDLINACVAYAPVVVAADGGAAQALAAGHTPRATIGDLDSLDSRTRSRLPGDSLHHIAEQDSTDLDKCLRNVTAPLILAVGFLGGRLDHTLATLWSVARHDGPRVVLVGPHDVAVLVERRAHLDLPADTRVSLWPVGTVRGTSTGLRWPIDGLTLDMQGALATSNAAVGGPVALSLSGRVFVMVPPAQLGAVVLACAPGAGGL